MTSIILILLSLAQPALPLHKADWMDKNTFSIVDLNGDGIITNHEITQVKKDYNLYWDKEGVNWKMREILDKPSKGVGPLIFKQGRY